MTFKKGENTNNLNVVLYSSFHNFHQSRIFYFSKNELLFYNYNYKRFLIFNYCAKLVWNDKSCG